MIALKDMELDIMKMDQFSIKASSKIVNGMDKDVSGFRMEALLKENSKCSDNLKVFTQMQQVTNG